MPTTYKPALEHKPLDLNGAWTSIRTDLEVSRKEILEAVGFTREYGGLGTSFRAIIEEQDANEVLDEIAAALTKAAAQLVAWGISPPNQVGANLRAIEANPVLWRACRPIEPATGRALTAALPNQRIPPAQQSLEEIRAAARAALARIERNRNRPKGPELDALVDDLPRIFRRFQDGPITRRVGTGTSRQAGKVFGPFVDFLRLVLPPLEAVCTELIGKPFRISLEQRVRAVDELSDATLSQRKRRASSRRIMGRLELELVLSSETHRAFAVAGTWKGVTDRNSP